MSSDGFIDASFRDPSGYLFRADGQLYRQINLVYKDEYDHLLVSGLYEALIEKNLLVSHEEVDSDIALTAEAYKVIKPVPLKCISYPYEWCFSQLKDAALATLEIHKTALEHGMVLKDASAYNVQFSKGRPTFIDTLSFERYREGTPWTAYGQFCRHFLAPLALMSHKDYRLIGLLRAHVDGVPLDLAAEILGFRSWLKFSLLMHLYFHARSQRHYADKTPSKAVTARKVSRHAMLALVDSLESSVRGLKWSPGGTEWADYYNDTNYTDEGMSQKRSLIEEFIEQLSPGCVWDLGANTGEFSRIASSKRIDTVAFDVDPSAVEVNYLNCRKEEMEYLLPLVLDLTNPTPAIGWAHRERMSFVERGPVDTVLALALIHHLAISNNVPFKKIADFLGTICESLIIEFVPKEDSQVQRLLATREDVFPTYDRNHFESSFSRIFSIERAETIETSGRILYLMRRKLRG